MEELLEFQIKKQISLLKQEAIE